VKRALTAGVTFLFLYFAGFAGYLLANSSFFDLTEIKLKGNAVVSRDEIIALSGLRIGANILRISRSQALAGILSHPYIKETSISRRFPDKLEIMVSERSPMAMIHAEGRYLILDGDGYCLE
jgi:cell division protein FtsQ